jgi:Flp pilus assembly protein TadG
VRLARGDDGAIAILVAMLSIMLFGFAAIVVDLGYARTVKGDAQSAVDASALAAAGVLADDSSPAQPFVAAYGAVKRLANENFGTTDADWDACVATRPGASWVQGGSGTNCILFNHAVNPTKVQVVLPPKHVDSFFGGLLGYHGMDVGALAQATIRQDDVPGCALCVLQSLDVSGPVAVDGGGVGGSSSAGVNSRVRSGGSITVQDPGAITFTESPTPATGSVYSSRPIIRDVVDPFLGDPLPRGGSGLPFPDPAPTRTVTCAAGDVLPEATYRNIIVTAPSSDPCVANGVVVVTRLLHVQAGASLAANVATIQLSCGTRSAPAECGSPTAGGRLQVDVTGQLSMSSLVPTAFSIVADPQNTAAMTLDGDVSVSHAIYGRSTPVTLGPATLSASGRIAVQQLTIEPGGSLAVNAAGGAPVPGPRQVGLYR